MAYTAVITSYAFTEEMHNTIKFSTREEQQGYFNINTLFNNPTLADYNHKFGDGINTTITIQKLGQTNANEYSGVLMGCNYCIVRDNNEDAKIKYYYYYITNTAYTTAGQVVLTLKLDVLQTYYIDLTFTPCLIKRAMLDRFILDGNTATFNYRADSLLFEPETTSVHAKRLVKREKLGLRLKGDISSKVFDFINQHIASWVYIYISSGEYTFKGQNNTPTDYSIENMQQIYYAGYLDTSTAVLCYPIYKNSTSNIKFGVRGGTLTTLDYLGYYNFLKNNIKSLNNIYNIKISQLPPIFYGGFDYEIQGNTLRIYGQNSSKGIYINGLYGHITEQGSGILSLISKNSKIADTIAFTTDSIVFEELQKSFNIEDIKKDSNNPKFNPKLQSIEFMSLAVSVGTGDTYEYDPQKLGVQPYTFSYSETLTAEIPKFYISYNPKDDEEIYTKESTTSYTGYIGSNDTSIPYNNNEYAKFISENKNFWLQTTNRRENILFLKYSCTI